MLDSAAARLVWFPDERCGFSIGRLVDIGRDEATVRPLASPAQSGAHFEWLADEPCDAADSKSFAYKQLYPCDQLDESSLRKCCDERQAANCKLLADADDSCALVQIHEAALLDNVRVRFSRDKIYTYVAHILVAVNPYVEIKGLHGAEAIARYQGKSLGTMPPHVYAIADKAFRDMKAAKRSQSIIISGESGAGKTESQKYVLRYLCLSGSQSGRLEKLILDANPLLEAFGNAKTIRNNNSSRFGKFIEIHYSNKFQVTGGLFFHYLLEKSRICTQSAGERNYHIFYQLCANLPDEQWRELELAAPDKFRYLSGGCTQYFERAASRCAKARQSLAQQTGGPICDQLIDDFECYEQTNKALGSFGLDAEQKLAVYSIVAAVLHLGNVEFCDDLEDNRNGCKVADGESERALQVTARLIGLDGDLLRQALVSRIMSTARGGHKGTVYMVQLNVQQAQAARDALAKAIYAKLFDYIVTRIVNKSIPFSSSSYYIGVLDVAGFEYFRQNSFEQFLINFCNEKLQQFFNKRILKEEQTIYEKEGLNLGRVEFVDNQDCIQLFEAKSSGIFDLLDEESRLPRPSARHFTECLHAAAQQQHVAGGRLAVPRASKQRHHRELRDDEGFLVRHFAGPVCYETSSFIEKNNDALHASLKSLMLEAANRLLVELFAAESTKEAPPVLVQQPAASKQAQNKLNFVSVGTTFRSQLGELMRKLESTGSHFVRCVKPNSEMVARKFDGAQILSQLHCSGMDAVLRLMQRGYPSRLSFNDLYAAYSDFLPRELARLDSHLFCRALFKAIGLGDADFRFGSSKVFFRATKFAEFDQIVRASSGEHVAELVARVSRWLLRWRWRKAQYCCLCAIKLARKIAYRRELIVRLQRNWRAALLQRSVKFRLVAIREARQICASLREFEQIAASEKSSKRESQQEALLADWTKLELESRLLRDELQEFVSSAAGAIQREMSAALASNNNKGERGQAAPQSAARTNLEQSKRTYVERVDLMRTKRDLLVRSIRDKIARQRELAELERQMAVEAAQREQQELARKADERLKQQRHELEQRRLAELAAAAAAAGGQLPSQRAQNEQRPQTQAAAPSPAGSGRDSAKQPLAPSASLHSLELLPSKFDLTKWKYSDLRDTINTSCDLELLETCKREFHRRLKVYHAWRAANSSGASAATAALGGGQLRAPSSVMAPPAGDRLDTPLPSFGAAPNEQRYFRIPFLKPGEPAAAAATGGAAQGQQRGWWFAHFDGQWIARQLELHPNREPILLVAGKHDIDMCELSLAETKLTSKRGAEILGQEFECEWRKHGGEPHGRGAQ